MKGEGWREKKHAKDAKPMENEREGGPKGRVDGCRETKEMTLGIQHPQAHGWLTYKPRDRFKLSFRDPRAAMVCNILSIFRFTRRVSPTGLRRVNPTSRLPGTEPGKVDVSCQVTWENSDSTLLHGFPPVNRGSYEEGSGWI